MNILEDISKPIHANNLYVTYLSVSGSNSLIHFTENVLQITQYSVKITLKPL